MPDNQDSNQLQNLINKIKEYEDEKGNPVVLPKEEKEIWKKSLEQNEAAEEVKNRIAVKKHLRWAIIGSMWLFFAFVFIYLLGIIVSVIFPIQKLGSLDSMREIVSIVFAFGVGSVISQGFKDFLNKNLS